MHWQIGCRKCRYFELLRSYKFWWQIFFSQNFGDTVLAKTSTSHFFHSLILILASSSSFDLRRNQCSEVSEIEEKYHMSYTFSCLLINYIILRWPFTKLSKIHKYPHDPEIRRLNMRRKTHKISNRALHTWSTSFWRIIGGFNMRENNSNLRCPTLYFLINKK